MYVKIIIEVTGMNFFEIMDFCGFDMVRADNMARSMYDIDAATKGIKHNGMDILESKSDRALSRRLRSPGSRKGPEYRLGICIYLDCCECLFNGGYAILG